MAEIEVRDVRAGDALALAGALRAADRAELDALGSTDHLAAIERSVRASFMCATATADGEIMCMLGVAPASMLSLAEGLPWLLGTDLITRNRGALVRRTGPYITAMLDLFPRLTNHVHADNAIAVRWLRRAGFTLHPAVRMTSTGALFYPFSMERPNV